MTLTDETLDRPQVDVVHPKVIHRVWLGPNEPDPVCVAFSDRWRELHPGWQVIDWHDDERGTYLIGRDGVDDLSVVRCADLVLASEYREAPTWVHRADMVMVELAWAFGGMVAGWDMEPTRSWEPLIDGHAAWCTPDADGFPGGGIFGAVDHHPAMMLILDTIRSRWARFPGADPNIVTGPYAWNEAIGPFDLDVLGTTRTAYPIHYTARHLTRDPATMGKLRQDPEVYAIHLFAGSWLEGGARVDR